MKFQIRYTFNDLINGLTESLKHSWRQGLIAAAIVLLPGSLLMLAGLQAIFGSLTTLMAEAGHLSPQNVPESLMAIIPAYALLFLADFVLALGAGFLGLFVLIWQRGVVAGQKPSLNFSIREALRLLPRFFGQVFILGSIFFMIAVVLELVIVGVVLLVVPSEIARSVDSLAVPLMVLGGVVVALGLLVVLIWLSIKSLFAHAAIVYEPELGAFEGIGRSFGLVKGRFWRTLGISWAINLILSFAVGILTGPIIFIFVLPTYLDFLQDIVHHNFDGNWLSIMPGLLNNMVGALAISAYIETIIIGVVWPQFLGLFYLDARVRAGQLPDESGPTDSPASIEAPPVTDTANSPNQAS